jgi:homocysteine S-methyltransferase
MVNPGTPDFDRELRRFAYKVEAGAEFAVTSPIFDPGMFERFVSRVESFRIPIIAGLWPFDSVRNAEFMANEVPGVSVPGALLARMRSSAGDRAAADEGVRIAQELGRELAPMAQGVQVACPSGRMTAAMAVLEAIR